MPNRKPLDLDALIAPMQAEALAGAKIVPFTLAGREWHAIDSANQIALFQAFTPNADDILTLNRTIEFFIGLLVEDERAEFEKVVRGIRGLSGPAFFEMLNQLVEQVVDRPTEPSPASSPSPAKKAGVRSTVRSSSRGVAGSRL